MENSYLASQDCGWRLSKNELWCQLKLNFMDRITARKPSRLAIGAHHTKSVTPFRKVSLPISGAADNPHLRHQVRIIIRRCRAERSLKRVLKLVASFLERHFPGLCKRRQQHGTHRQHGYPQQCRADWPLNEYQGVAARKQHGASEKFLHQRA